LNTLGTNHNFVLENRLNKREVQNEIDSNFDRAGRDGAPRDFASARCHA
jgi:hypothetical protein